jgi:hypothetical protein
MAGQQINQETEMNKSFVPVEFTAMSDICVVGYNSENADCVNPKGAIYGYQVYIQADSEYGDTRIMYVGEPTMDGDNATLKAQKQADAMMARWNNFKKLPINFGAWVEGRAVYGSDAYQAYGQDDELALEMREEEESWY